MGPLLIRRLKVMSSNTFLNAVGITSTLKALREPKLETLRKGRKRRHSDWMVTSGSRRKDIKGLVLPTTR